MTHLDRRNVLSGLAILAGSTAVPSISWANPTKSYAEQFTQSAEVNDWAIGWDNPPAHSLDTRALKLIRGKMPDGLVGRFYRNGPAIRERSGVRVQHWFDGDGMIQAFDLNESSLSHKGRIVQTEKYLRDEAARQFTSGGFGTQISGIKPEARLDYANPANTSILPIGGELLALWEGGSAYRMDAGSLETIGKKVWNPQLGEVPFSAHPKVETDGTIWNFGQNAFTESLIIYKLSPSGKVRNIAMVKDVPGGMIHDFCMTKRHLIFVVPSLRLSKRGETYLDCFAWQAETGQRVIVLNKDDLDQRRNFELPPGLQFHFGNAYEEKNGDIRFAMCMVNPDSITTGLKDIMRGKLSHPTDGTLTHVCLRQNGGAEIVQQIKTMGSHEFPQFNANLAGQHAKYLYTVGRTHKGRPNESAVLRHNIDTGGIQSFDYGLTAIAEEHIFVPKPAATREDEGWLIGTVLDYAAKVTRLNILDAQNIAGGPIAVFELPYALPLGFHGKWVGKP